jgi:hypothetical protein
MQPYLFSMSLNNDAYCFDGEILGVNQARRRCLLGEVAREHLRRQRSPASARSPRSTGAGLAVPVAIQYPPVCSSTKSKRIETSRGGIPSQGERSKAPHPKDQNWEKCISKCCIFACLATVLITGIKEPISSFLHSENKTSPPPLRFTYR